jgi:hypothetical protein
MASLKFITSNLIEGSATSLKNGTGAPAPARDEVSPYVMENAMKHARRVLWQNSGGANMDVDFDTGFDWGVRVGGIAGHRPIAGALTGITAFTIKSSTDANGYPPITGNPWTNVPGAVSVSTASARDKGVIFDSDVTARYFRYSLVVGSVFTLGKFLLNWITHDLGILHSPGATVLNISSNVEERTIGQDPVVSYVGDNRELRSLPYRNILSAVAVKLDALRKLRNSFFMFDKDNVMREYIVQRGEIPFTIEREQAADTIYSAQVELEQLG